MSDIARGNVEILVRAGASSRPQDDARQRAMVDAYLKFEPSTRQRIEVSKSLAEMSVDQAGSQLQNDLMQSTREERESAESWKPEGEDYGTSASQEIDRSPSMSFMDSPEMSFRSVLHNNDSPVFCGLTTREHVVSSIQQRLSRHPEFSWTSPRSVISDSQPGSSLRLPVHKSQGKVLDEYYSRIAGSRDSSESDLEVDTSEGQPRRSTRNSRKLRSNLSFSEAALSSSPDRLPSSPSPNKTFHSKSTRIFRRLENLPSPPKMARRRGMEDCLADVSMKRLDVSKSDIPFTETSTSTPGQLMSLPPEVLLEMESENSESGQRRVSPPKKDVAGPKKRLLQFQDIRRSTKCFTVSKDMAAHQKRRKVDKDITTTIIPETQPELSRSVSLPLPQLPLKTKNQLESPTPCSQPEPLALTSSTNPNSSGAGSTIATWSNTLEINSNAPGVSHQSLSPEDLITPQLRRLVTKMSGDNPFTPLSRVRDLRPLERGNWTVNCSTWNDGLRTRAWDMLGNFIGKGMAGWGVRCVRSEQHDQIRVFCWGVVVEHIWYLLFLASEGKIKHVQASWTGGDGTELIIMP